MIIFTNSECGSCGRNFRILILEKNVVGTNNQKQSVVVLGNFAKFIGNTCNGVFFASKVAARLAPLA